MELKKESIEKLTNFISGSLSSGIAVSLFYPLEHIKTLLQMNSSDTKRQNLIKEIFFIIKKTKNQKGIRGFYTGFSAYLIYTMIGYGTYFSFFEYFKKKFPKSSKLIPSLFAAIINVLLTTPLSVITNIIISAEKRKNITISLKTAILQIYAKNGLKGYYKGLLISLLLVINPVINFTLQSFLKKIFSRKIKNPDFSNLFSGAISKFIATISTYPYTTIKVNQQGKIKSVGVLKTIFFIYFSFGVRGFYKGVVSKLGYTVLNTAFMFLLYERLKVWVRKVLEGRFAREKRNKVKKG